MAKLSYISRISCALHESGIGIFTGSVNNAVFRSQSAPSKTNDRSDLESRPSFFQYLMILIPFEFNLCFGTRVSVQGVESLWGDCRFIPAD